MISILPILAVTIIQVPIIIKILCQGKVEQNPLRQELPVSSHLSSGLFLHFFLDNPVRTQENSKTNGGLRATVSSRGNGQYSTLKLLGIGDASWSYGLKICCGKNRPYFFLAARTTDLASPTRSPRLDLFFAKKIRDGEAAPRADSRSGTIRSS